MELRELIRRFRVEAHDKVEPYFIENEDVIAWLNEAVSEACIRGRLLHESQDADVCGITVLTNQSHYTLHESLYELTSVVFNPFGERAVDLKLCSEEYLDRYYSDNWRTMSDMPKFAIQSDTGIRLVPSPVAAGNIRVEGYRVPINQMEDDTDVPEINTVHHVHLIQWVLHQAFNVPDAEFFDPNRAAIAEQAFTDYFGVRPDSDLRRITREDTPHHVQPFMP